MRFSLHDKERLAFISNLSTMLGAGIPIMEAVDSMRSESKGNTAKVLDQLKRDLNEGRTVSTSFANMGETFDPVTINLVKAAEEAGTLEESLKDLTKAVKKDIEFSEKVKAALTYPIFVFCIFIGVFLLILGFVVPRVATVFTRLKAKLPLPTKILVLASNIFLKYWMLLVLLTIVFGIVIAITYSLKKRAFFNFLYSLPLLRRLGREIDLTRFTRSMALLLNSGIPIVDALSLSSHVVAKKEMMSLITKSKEVVASGKELSGSLRKMQKIIPSFMIRVIEVGEKSGKLEHSMQELAEYFDEEVSNTLKKLTTLLEPIMLVVIGLLVGGMMLSIIAPIYQLIGNIGGR